MRKTKTPSKPKSKTPRCKLCRARKEANDRLVTENETLSSQLRSTTNNNAGLHRMLEAAQEAQKALQGKLTEAEKARALIRRSLYNVLRTVGGTVAFKAVDEAQPEKRMIAKRDPVSGLVTMFIDGYSPESNEAAVLQAYL
jgi:hypothetical protein